VKSILLWLAGGVLPFCRQAGRARAAVVLALLVTLVVSFIPHSIFGSEHDDRRGAGHGTAG